MFNIRVVLFPSLYMFRSIKLMMMILIDRNIEQPEY
jgi:hypothetical protein